MTTSITEIILNIVKTIIADVLPITDIVAKKESEQYRVNIITEKSSDHFDMDLILALQHIARVILHKKLPKDRTHFILDINNCRLEREKYLQTLIPELAENDVIKSGATLILIGLNAYERMVAHNILKDVTDLETSSVGIEPNRRLLIRPSSEVGATGMENAKIIDLKEVLEKSLKISN